MNTFTMTTSPRRGGGRAIAAWMAALTLAVGSTVALSAWAQPGPGGPGKGAHMGAGPMGLPMMGRGLDRMLDSVDATDAQRSQIKQITEAARADMKAQMEAGRALHERSMEVFTAPNVDANAAEAVRQQMLQQHDQASKRMMQVMLDVSRVLTPEQRARLATQMKDRAARMQQHMDSHGGRPRQ